MSEARKFVPQQERRTPLKRPEVKQPKESPEVTAILAGFNPKERANIIAQAKADTIKAFKAHAALEQANAATMKSQRKVVEAGTTDEQRDTQRNIAMQDAYRLRLNQLATFYKMPENEREEVAEKAMAKVDEIVKQKEARGETVTTEERQDMIEAQMTSRLGSMEMDEDDIDSALNF